MRPLGGWTVAGALGAGIERIDATLAAFGPPGEALRGRAPALENLHVTLQARYNRAADDSDFPDTSFRQAGVTLRYPF